DARFAVAGRRRAGMRASAEPGRRAVDRDLRAGRPGREPRGPGPRPVGDRGRATRAGSGNAVNLPSSLVRYTLLLALLVAAAFLAWWTYRTTATLESLGERSIIDSTVLLTREKVDRVEQLLISDDNAVNHLVNPDDLDPLVVRWTESADRTSPT